MAGVPSSMASTLPCTSNHVVCGLPFGFAALGGAVTVFLKRTPVPDNAPNSYRVVVIKEPGAVSCVCRSRRSHWIVVFVVSGDLLGLYVPIEPRGSVIG